EDGIRDRNVTGVQTCALPIFPVEVPHCYRCRVTPHAEVGGAPEGAGAVPQQDGYAVGGVVAQSQVLLAVPVEVPHLHGSGVSAQIGRASCRECVMTNIGDMSA